MEGSIAIRPMTPDIDTSNGNVWYSYFVYDAVIMACYALVYMEESSDCDMSSRTPLSSNSYFGNIESYWTCGQELSNVLLNTQLPSDWTMTGSIYLRENSRRMPYELVNLQNGEWIVVAQFSWNSTITQSLIDGDSTCTNLANSAKSASQNQYNQLTQEFSIKTCSLSRNTSGIQCEDEIIDFFDKCFSDIMGLDVTYTSSDTSEERLTSTWKFSSSSSILWTGCDINLIKNCSRPIGAQFSTNNPLKVLVNLIEPWGKWDSSKSDITDDSINMILGWTGFLPTLWNFIIETQGLKCEYSDGYYYSQQEAIELVTNGTYDVALGAFTITSSRSAQVRFLHQFYGGGQRILTFNPSIIDSNAWFFLIPFKNELWYTWLVAIIVVAHLLWIMEWDTPTFKQYDDATGRLKHMSYNASILEALTISTSVLYFTHEPPRGKHSRWFIAVWEYIVLILISAYTANMTSFITNSSAAESVVDQESDLYLAQTQVITVPDTASADILEAANITYTPCDTPDICLDLMYTSLNASFNDSLDTILYNAFVYDDINIEYWARTSTQCSLITGGSSFNSFSAAIPVRYNYIPDDILNALDLLIIKLWSNGTMNAWLKEFISSDYPCDEYVGAADETTPLDVLSFWYLWILIGGGSLLFCTVVICTVERSATPIDDQLHELNQLVKHGAEQITRVGTLSQTSMGGGGGGDNTKDNNIDLYSGHDDHLQEPLTDNDDNDNQRTNDDVKELKKSIELQPLVTKDNTDSYNNDNNDDIGNVGKSPKEMFKERTQEKLQALSTLAIDFDPLKDAMNKPPRRQSEKESYRNQQKEKEKKEQGHNQDNKISKEEEKPKKNDEEWSKSYSLKIVYDEEPPNDNDDDNNGKEKANEETPLITQDENNEEAYEQIDEQIDEQQVNEEQEPQDQQFEDQQSEDQAEDPKPENEQAQTQQEENEKEEDNQEEAENDQEKGNDEAVDKEEKENEEKEKPNLSTVNTVTALSEDDITAAFVGDENVDNDGNDDDGNGNDGNGDDGNGDNVNELPEPTENINDRLTSTEL